VWRQHRTSSAKAEHDFDVVRLTVGEEDSVSSMFAVERSGTQLETILELAEKTPGRGEGCRY
jgi:hypothetical protein